MDGYEDPTQEESQQNFTVRRGASNQPVHQADVLPHNLDAITAAVEEGDRLDSCDRNAVPGYATRRALIIAAQYEVHFTEYPSLPATLQDVVHIRSMLLDSGYEPGNIRVLVEGFEDDDQPTRENTIQSLKWLVSNTRAGDSRYFHFSGHGICLDSKPGEGKQAREIPKDNVPIEHGDHELDPYSAKSRPYTELKNISIAEDKIKYYNEAIVTSYKRVPHRRLREFGSDFEYNIVRDNILNQHFAALPDGCKLTCTFDCCHSGRLINNNFKLKGAGFRGRVQKPMAETGSGFYQMSAEYADGQIPEFELSAATENKLTLQAPGTLPPNGANESNPRSFQAVAKAVTTVSGIIRNWVSPPLVNLSNTLPAEEIQRDKIKADVLAWSACHQRQEALDYDVIEGGVFTRAFTRIIKEVGGAGKTVSEVYDMVNKAIKEDIERKVAKDNLKNAKEGAQRTKQPALKTTPLLQYTQVWTSLGEGKDESKALLKLEEIFSV